jgi:hypothetical protein
LLIGGTGTTTLQLLTVTSWDGWREPGGEFRISRLLHELVAGDDFVEIDGGRFVLDDIDRVAYWASVSGDVRGSSGSSWGVSFELRLGQGDRESRFSIPGRQVRSWEVGVDACPDYWHQLIDLIDAAVCRRLASEASATLMAGTEVRFGAIIGDATGLRRRGPLAKTLRWDDIAGTNVEGPNPPFQTYPRSDELQVLVSGRRGKTNVMLTAGMEAWNVVVLPAVISALTSPTSLS